MGKEREGLTELFRADAKAEGEDVVIGGWELNGATDTSDAQWFSEKVDRNNAPWIFEAGEAYRSIATLELLATLFCLVAFGIPNNTAGPMRFSGGTDNLGNRCGFKNDDH